MPAPRREPRLAKICLSVTLAATVLTGCSAPPHPARALTNSAPPPASRYFYGRIVDQQGPTWTVHGIRGNTYTVTITSMTSFGTLFHPLRRQQFGIGDWIRVACNFSGTSVTATAMKFTKHTTKARSRHQH
jgi:hypothetical protein